MTKLCARGKSAAKRKFKVYPSAYANAYASKICAGKIKDPSGKKKKDWGPKIRNTGSKKIGEVVEPVKKKIYEDQYKKNKRVGKSGGKYYLQIKIPGMNKGAYVGSHIKSEVGGQKVSNKSYEDYYKDLI